MTDYTTETGFTLNLHEVKFPPRAPKDIEIRKGEFQSASEPVVILHHGCILSVWPLALDTIDALCEELRRLVQPWDSKEEEDGQDIS